MTAIAPLEAQIEELRRVVSPPKPDWETPIEALNLSHKAWIALKYAGTHSVSQLMTEYSMNTLMDINGLT
jgi:hypothetical protein